MAKSIKLKDNTYIDSTGVSHNQQKLSDIIIIDNFNDTSGSDWKEMLRNKLDYCIPKFTRQYQTIMLNGGWANINFGLAIVTRINTIYQIVWFSSNGVCFCKRSNANTYDYWSNFSLPINVDANGWSRREYTDRVEYWKYMSFSWTYNGNSWGSVELGGTWLKLPSDISNYNTAYMMFTGGAICDDRAITVDVGLSNGDNRLYLGYVNHWSGSVTTMCRLNIKLVRYK